MVKSGVGMSFSEVLSIFMHLDQHLNQWAAWMGPWLYVLVFVIVFCETGLVITPFLPGDSLLFALGAMTATENAVLDYWILYFSLITAAILGDFAGYSMGRYFGMRLFKDENSRLFNRRHLNTTQLYYERHGGKTIVIARFLPVVRSFAPFVAGMGQMRYRRFVAYNVGGAILWVSVFLSAGHFFGNLPMIKRNFQFVILAIIVVSAMPIVIEFWRSRQKSN